MMLSSDERIHVDPSVTVADLELVLTAWFGLHKRDLNLLTHGPVRDGDVEDRTQGFVGDLLLKVFREGCL